MAQAQLFDTDAMEKDATISECGLYRYDLRRTWDRSAHVTFLMINPSTADAEDDDPTILKCIRFAKSWGFGGIYVVNLYAFRATNIDDLWKATDPIGHYNNATILVHAALGPVIAAWGAKPKAKARADEVCRKIAETGQPLYALRLTKGGYPEHPLFLPENLKPFVWKPAPGA